MNATVASMRGFPAWCKREWPTLLVIAIGLAAQLFLITRPLASLLSNILPDDAFYAFAIARNIAHGLGSTFDGINLTDGYHPLWIWILVPIFRWFSVGGTMDLAPIRVALLLSVVFNAVAALFVARILTRFSRSQWVRAFGMVVWLLNPYFLYQTLNGLETSLSLLLFSIFFFLVLRIEERRAVGGYWLVGIVSGLMVLARLDMAIYVVAFLAWIFIREGKRGWRNALITAVCAGVVTSPWFIWNALTFHGLLTSSSEAEAMVNHQLIVQDHGASMLQMLKAIVYSTQTALVEIFQWTGMYSIALALIGALLSLVATRSVKVPRWKEMPATLALLGGFVLLFVANASVRWTVRSWYFVSFDLFIAILAVFVLERCKDALPYKRTLAVLLLLVTLFSFGVDWSKDVDGAMPQQLINLEAAQWMSANLPAGTEVGVFNAGIEGYFSSVRVINLDGLVNNRAYDAMRQHALWPYVLSSNIAYIADYDLYMTYRYKSFLGADPYQDLTLVYSIGGSGPHGADALNIYRISTSSAPATRKP